MALEIGHKDALDAHFPTPFMTRTHSNVAPVNAALKKLILELRATSPSVTRYTSNRGGFQTDVDFLNREEPAVKVLAQMIGHATRAFYDRYIPAELSVRMTKCRLNVWGWAVVMQASDSNSRHHHPDSNVSGVYYVDLPPRAASADPMEGAIVFSDPRLLAPQLKMAKNHRTALWFTPEAGTLFVFPSYYEHEVIPHREAGPRISVAFSSRIEILETAELARPA